MRTAVLFATAPAAEDLPAAELPLAGTTPLRRLLGQLAELGVLEVHVITRPAFAAALGPAVKNPEPELRLHVCADRAADLRTVETLGRERGEGGLALLYGDIVVQRDALDRLIADELASTAILATGAPSSAGAPVRAPSGRVVSAGSPYHWVGSPNASFGGVLSVAPGDRTALADAAERVRRLVSRPLPEGWAEELERKVAVDGWKQDVAAEDVPALLLAALARAGVPVAARDVRELFWARPLTGADAEQTAAALRDHDDDRARLDSAVKAADGFFTTFFVSTYSKYIARWAARRGITPNQVTLFSMGVGILAAVGFATGERWGLVTGALLLYAAFVFDCVDGQLARYTRKFSRFGAWLDSVLDRGKEYLVYAGLAIGSTRGFGVDAWPLAVAALALQTARHMVEFSYWEVHYRAEESVEQPPLERPGDRSGAAPRGISAATLGFSRLLDRPPGIQWIKRMIGFPIGERFAAIALLAAATTPRTVFIVLLVWGGVAAVYNGAAHVMHSVMRSQIADRRSQASFRDDGPLALAVGRVFGRNIPLAGALLVPLGSLPLVVALAADGWDASHLALLPGIATVVLMGGASEARWGRFDWAVPGMLRALEYGLLLWMAVLAHGSAVKSCFALVAVLAFHHYDSVYRLRQQMPSPRWVGFAASGWEGRIVLAYIALLTAVSTAGMAVAAALLAVMFVGESASVWLRGDG